MIKQEFWTQDYSNLGKDRLMQMAESLNARHQVPLRLADWKSQRSNLLHQLRENMGLKQITCALDIREYGEIKRPTCSIKKITYQSRPGFRVTANLYLPKGTGPFPGLLIPHGHLTEGKTSPRVQSRCLLFASEGFVVLAVDAFGSGERCTDAGKFEYHGGNIGFSLLNIGETLLGMQVNDNLKGIDLLQSLDEVDHSLIGVTGASGGGNQTMWVSALDARVKAAVPVVSVGTFESYVTETNCVCELLPNGLCLTEEWAVLGLIAPNALLMINSLQDIRPFSVKEMLRSYTAARDVFDLYGVGDRLACQAIDLPHGYWPEMQRHALGWFRRWLQNEGEGRACKISETSPLPHEELLVFPDHIRPSEVKSIFDFVHHIATGFVSGHLNKEDPGEMTGKIRELKNLLHLPKEMPSIQLKFCHQTTEGKNMVKSIQLEVEPGVILPVEIYSSCDNEPTSALLVVHHKGVKSIVHEPWMETWLQSGKALVFADLRNSGSMLWDSKIERLPLFHNASRSTLWLGHTMIGEWVIDLSSITKYLKSDCDIADLDLLAYQDAGIAGLCLGVLEDIFEKITTHETLGSLIPQKGPGKHSMAVQIPNILQWGDISMMAALAKADVQLLNPTLPDGKVYAADQRGKLTREISKLKSLFALTNQAIVAVGDFPAF